MTVNSAAEGLVFMGLLLRVRGLGRRAVRARGVILRKLPAPRYPRHKAAGKILADMKKHDRKMVADGELVSDELIRVAVLWHEQWHEGLEEASRYYFGEKVRCVDIALRSVAFRRVGCCLVRSLILSLTPRVSFVCAEPQGYDRNFAAFAPYDA